MNANFNFIDKVPINKLDKVINYRGKLQTLFMTLGESIPAFNSEYSHSYPKVCYCTLNAMVINDHYFIDKN